MQNRTVVTAGVVSGLVAFLLVGIQTSDAGEAAQGDKAHGQDEAAELGRRLFERQWTTGDPISAKGDGWGPLANARSCGECHHQGGLGGAGAQPHNVDLLTIVDLGDQRSRVSTGAARQFVLQVNPAFEDQTSVVVHRFGATLTYEVYRQNLLARQVHSVLELPALGRAPAKKVRVKLGQENGKQLLQVGPALMQWTQRSTPTLFGAGLIDRIDSVTLERLAASQSSRASKVSGSVAGRFGWRGQTRTLEEFVVGACANELGLQTTSHVQPRNPIDPSYANRGVDLQNHHTAALVKFVRELPSPSQRLPQGRAAKAAWRRGGALFEKSRCQTCHVANVHPAKGIYSDLLLHDMGLSLSDPAGAPTEQAIKRTSQDYYGLAAPASPEQLVAAKRLWRTPPLWGVRDTAPYLHDGRAETLDEAIRLHGGEAEHSKQIYLRMTRSDRRELVAFVRTLGTPR